MTSVARKAEEYSFPCDQWFSNKDEGDVSLIELPAVVKGKEVAEGMLSMTARILLCHRTDESG